MKLSWKLWHAHSINIYSKVTKSEKNPSICRDSIETFSKFITHLSTLKRVASYSVFTITKMYSKHPHSQNFHRKLPIRHEIHIFLTWIFNRIIFTCICVDIYYPFEGMAWSRATRNNTSRRSNTRKFKSGLSLPVPYQRLRSIILLKPQNLEKYLNISSNVKSSFYWLCPLHVSYLDGSSHSVLLFKT